MVGDDAHCLARALVRVVPLSRERFELCDRAREQVGLVAVVQPVEKEQHAVEPEARIDVLVFERDVAVFRLAVLHVHVVSDLDVIVGEDGIRLFGIDGIEPLVVGTAGRADGALELPPVVRLGKIEDMLFPDAERLQKARRLLVARGGVVALEHGGTQHVPVQPVHLGEDLVRPGSLFLFEIIAERPVAHHLEEGEMRRVAHRFDVHRPDASLHVAQALAEGVRLSEQVGHEGLHARHVEHDARRPVADQGYRAHVDVSLALIKFQPALAELFGSDFHCRITS